MCAAAALRWPASPCCPRPPEADTPVLARYPYLTDLTTTSVDVVWATSAADATGGVVSYGPPGNCGQSIATGSRCADQLHRVR